jgi:hypothetical protein
VAEAQLFEPLDVAKASPFIFENNELAGFVSIPLLLLDPAHKQSRAVGKAFVDVDHDQVLRCEESPSCGRLSHRVGSRAFSKAFGGCVEWELQ